MATTRETLRLLRGMRIEVSATVDETTRALVRAWARAWDELSRDWQAAVTDLMTQSADGEWPSRYTVTRAERTLKALDATRNALLDLGDTAGVRIVETLPDLTSQAALWEARLIGSQMPPRAGTAAELVTRFDRINPASLEQIVRRTTGQITSLLLPLSIEATAAMHALLIRGIAVGDNPRTVARQMMRRLQGAFNGGLTRALVVARTEMLDAHRNAARAQDIANTNVLAGWQWVAQLDHRTCPSCWAQHGSEHPVDEAGPLDHQQGRCARVPLPKSWRQLGFDVPEPPSALPDARAVFDAMPEADQVAVMGAPRLDLLRSGQMQWGDLSVRRSTIGWRDSYAPRPVRDLAAAAVL